MLYIRVVVLNGKVFFCLPKKAIKKTNAADMVKSAIMKTAHGIYSLLMKPLVVSTVKLNINERSIMPTATTIPKTERFILLNKALPPD